jgi:thioredoxin reductase (NADPH)
MADVHSGTGTELDPSDPYAREAQTFPRLSEDMALRVARYGTEELLKAGEIIFEFKMTVHIRA